MMQMPIRLFRKAGASGHVFLLKNGEIKDKGLAYSGWIGLKTTVAVVPVTPQIIPFSIEAMTNDKQNVVVRGSLAVTFVPGTAVAKFNFTVDPQSGSYTDNCMPIVNARVIERVLRAVLGKTKGLGIEEAVRSQQEIEDAIIETIDKEAFLADGISVDSCSVQKVTPKDDDVENALGSRERQAMLAEADAALHGRRMKAAENERKVKQYEADTRLALEQKQGELLEEQAKNKKKEADTDAEAMRIRMEPLKEVEAGKLLGAAVLEMAKTGRIGNVALTTDLLSAINQK